MGMKTITQLTSQTADIRVHSSDVDGNVRMFNRAGRKRWGHECELIKLALKVELGAILPAVPNSS